MSDADIDLLIVGAGPAGCAAAAQFRRLGGRPVLLDRTGCAGGLIANAFRVENYPGGERPLRGQELAQRLGHHLERFALKVRKGVVTSIRPVERKVPSPLREPGPFEDEAPVQPATSRAGFKVTGDFGEMLARAVILACGTVPVQPGIPGETQPGLRVFYEVNELLPYLPRTAAVVGGGEAALDYALSLAEAGAKVLLLVRSSKLRANCRLVEMVEKEPRITVSLDTPVREIQKAPGNRVDLLLPSRRLSVDGALLAVGRRTLAGSLVPPPPPPLPGAPTASPLRFQAESPSCLTSIPGLFIAGDARLGGLGQVGIAVGDGLWCAAAAMAFLNG